MEKKIAEKNKEGGEGGTGVEGEKGYGSKPPAARPEFPNRKALIDDAIASAGPNATKQDIKIAIKKALKGKCFPDAAIVYPDGSKTFIDFKFPCPPGHPSGKGTSKGGRKGVMSESQQNMYDALGRSSGNGKAFPVAPRF
jgi:hypothetical protein